MKPGLVLWCWDVYESEKGLTACFLLHGWMFNRQPDASEWEKPKVKAAGLIEALCSLRMCA